VFIQRSRQIRRCRALVVGMRHDEQNVRFVALVGQRNRFRLLRRARDSRQKKPKSQN
jgi:hypothetical protein